jgi:hypothetical protein
MEHREFTPLTFNEEVHQLREKNGIYFSNLITTVESGDVNLKTMREVKGYLDEVLRLTNVTRYQKLRDTIQSDESRKELQQVWTSLYPKVQNANARLHDLAAHDTSEMARQLHDVQDALNHFCALVEKIFNSPS